MIDPFRKLEPPPGGLARLRARLDLQEDRGLRGWIPAVCVIGALTALLVVVLSLPAAPVTTLPDADSPGLIALGLAPPPSAPVTAQGEFAVEAVSSSREVLFYRVASLAPGAATGDR